MGNVEFEDSNYSSQSSQSKKRIAKTGAISNLIIKLKLAKNTQNAQKVLLIIIILGFAWTFYYYFGGLL